METTIPDHRRISILDSLRGFALLGIFLINITSIGSAGGPPTFEAKPVILDELYNQFLLLMVESKFFTLFSFLFGVGFAIQLTRADEQQIDIVPRFSRRLIGLFFFGVLHIILFWEGDILVIYSVAGAALLLFRKCRNKTLLIWVGSLLIIPILGVTGAATTVEVFRAHPYYSGKLSEADQSLSQLFSSLSGEGSNLTYVGSIKERVSSYIEVIPLLVSRMSTIFAMFLLGLYAGKNKIFVRMNEYKNIVEWLSIWGLSIGLILNGTVVYLFNHLLPVTAIVVLLYNQTLTGPLLALSYASIILLLSRKRFWKPMLTWFSFTGRMALTNYLLQSAICSFIFNKYGLGLEGQISLTGTFLMALLIYGMLIIGSKLWLTYFQFGPLEWIWRCITYWKIQTIRKLS